VRPRLKLKRSHLDLNRNKKQLVFYSFEILLGSPFGNFKSSIDKYVASIIFGGHAVFDFSTLVMSSRGIVDAEDSFSFTSRLEILDFTRGSLVILGSCKSLENMLIFSVGRRSRRRL
jgi:hypothetical protein